MGKTLFPQRPLLSANGPKRVEVGRMSSRAGEVRLSKRDNREHVFENGQVQAREDVQKE